MKKILSEVDTVLSLGSRCPSMLSGPSPSIFVFIEVAFSLLQAQTA